MSILLISLVIVIIYRALFPRKESIYYNGPKPSKRESNSNQNWIADHIEQYPNSSDELIKAYPQAARRARATIRYKELERLRASGQMDEIDYQRELQKILPLIDIREDISY